MYMQWPRQDIGRFRNQEFLTFMVALEEQSNLLRAKVLQSTLSGPKYRFIFVCFGTDSWSFMKYLIVVP